MYLDPSKIRDNVVKIRLNDSEAALVNALVNYTGEQKATMLRELLLEQARLVLGVDLALSGDGMEGHKSAHQGH